MIGLRASLPYELIPVLHLPFFYFPETPGQIYHVMQFWQAVCTHIEYLLILFTLSLDVSDDVLTAFYHKPKAGATLENSFLLLLWSIRKVFIIEI